MIPEISSRLDLRGEGREKEPHNELLFKIPFCDDHAINPHHLLNLTLKSRILNDHIAYSVQDVLETSLATNSSFSSDGRGLQFGPLLRGSAMGLDM